MNVAVQFSFLYPHLQPLEHHSSLGRRVLVENTLFTPPLVYDETHILPSILWYAVSE